MSASPTTMTRARNNTPAIKQGSCPPTRSARPPRNLAKPVRSRAISHRKNPFTPTRRRAQNAAPMARGNGSEPTKNFSLTQSLQRYGADRWGHRFLDVNDRGHLEFQPPGVASVDLQALAQTLSARGILPPFVVRFPSMITEQMRRLSQAFVTAATDNNYTQPHIGVYPVKVNQRRSVVNTVVSAREAYRYGLEAGSKPELLLAMAQPVIDGLPLICNGFKDREYIRMAYHAAELGHQVIVVLEGSREVYRYLEVRQEAEWTATPEIGIRAKLYSKGSGRWQGSAGEAAKFGLTSSEILAVINELRNAGALDRLTMLHFHAGSQITQIKRIKQAIREGMRIWGCLWQMAPSMRYLDIGGGVGVDYDGSRTSYPSSANYTIEEYASQAIFEIREVADDMEVPHPTIVTESGRILVANHAVTITNLREVQGQLLPLPEPSDEEDRLIEMLRYTLEHISIKNIEEYFHDAVDYRDEALQAFSRGHLSLEDRANAEGLFQRVRLKCARLLEQMPHPPEEIVEHLARAEHKYLVNFSLFQSLPDAWSIGHVFPACPLARHERRPEINAQIVDITCDSDGCVRTFAHPDDNLSSLPLHRVGSGDEDYYLGFFMTGAYQDSLSTVHNLFSRCHEVIVRRPEDDALLVGSEVVEFEGHALEIKSGMSNEAVLETMDFDMEAVNQSLRDRHLHVETTLGHPWVLGILRSYPYLTR
ncbi:MAG: biosynthetic arginine decarboxylase [Myxococcales bacterium FL481]|nr:MAG: biosynthetic arginine decarboxylase [Myxococcales bacterium FL481]